jgi:hypothetical protein
VVDSVGRTMEGRGVRSYNDEGGFEGGSEGHSNGKYTKTRDVLLNKLMLLTLKRDAYAVSLKSMT